MEAIKQFLASKLLWFILIPVLLLVFAAVKYFFPSYPDDNKVEEAVEQVIQDGSGANVDLTPSSPESNSLN